MRNLSYVDGYMPRVWKRWNGRFSWTGRDAAGNLVRPGAYLYRIDLGADAGGDTTLRTVAVAY